MLCVGVCDVHVCVCVCKRQVGIWLCFKQDGDDTASSLTSTPTTHTAYIIHINYRLMRATSRVFSLGVMCAEVCVTPFCPTATPNRIKQASVPESKALTRKAEG